MPLKGKYNYVNWKGHSEVPSGTAARACAKRERRRDERRIGREVVVQSWREWAAEQWEPLSLHEVRVHEVDFDAWADLYVYDHDGRWDEYEYE